MQREVPCPKPKAHLRQGSVGVQHLTATEAGLPAHLHHQPALHLREKQSLKV